MIERTANATRLPEGELLRWIENVQRNAAGDVAVAFPSDGRVDDRPIGDSELERLLGRG